MNRENFPQFDNYVCDGDTIKWTHEGFDFVAHVVYDTDTKPTDYDCFDEPDTQRWRDDEWFYCGVVLSVSLKGVELDANAASLWGIDCNFGDGNSYLAEVAQELESEALDVARAEVARIRELLKEPA